MEWDLPYWSLKSSQPPRSFLYGVRKRLDFLDREQPRHLCEVLIAVATALGEARSGCATPPLFSLRVWLC